MSPRRQLRSPSGKVLATLMVVPPVAILAAIPWLKQQPGEVVFLLSGVAVVLTIGASLGLALKADHGLDEWQRTGARFSSQWGWTAGSSLIALLLALPGFRDLIVWVVTAWAGSSLPDPKPVLLAFTFGFMAVTIAQLLCVVVLNVVWSLRMSRGTS